MQKKRNKGRLVFLVIEGGDGVGKTTLSRNIRNFLDACGMSVLVTREPGGGWFGEAMRSILLDARAHNLSKHAELLAFLSARMQHLEEVLLPAMKTHDVVICDRFTDSTIVYQGILKELGVEYVQALCQRIYGHIVKPDLTILIDVPTSTVMQRVKSLEASWNHYDRACMGSDVVRNGFLQLAKNAQDPRSYLVIDGSLDSAEVLKVALKHISETFGLTKINTRLCENLNN